MRRFVVAAAVVLAVGLVVGALEPRHMGGWGSLWGPWPMVLGVSGALLILAAGLVRMARRGS